jgi:uncharacterized membrane-anchored protein
MTPPGHVRAVVHSRVPEITLAFWVLTTLATTPGKTFAEFLGVEVGLGLRTTAYLMGALLILALAAQFVTKRYASSIYWAVVVLISVVGTLLTDVLVDVVGVPLWVSTIILMALLALTFGVWFAREHTLSMSAIFTRRSEAFYWLAILLSFALGTAAGELVMQGLGQGYLVGVVLFASLVGVVVVARFFFRVSAVGCFWVAYVLTRPLGAAIGDLLSQSRDDGGLGAGMAPTAAAFLIVIVALAAYLGFRVREARAELEGRPPGTMPTVRP